MDLSIVTTMYCSRQYLEEFHRRAGDAARAAALDYEIIFVNDGSPDESLEFAVALYEKDPRVKVIDLSRNFGHHKAIMTGLAHAKGELVFLIDCDLEESPELLADFMAEMKNTGADVVFGVQKKRKGGLFKRVFGNMYYLILNSLSDRKIAENLITARLMTARYVRNLVLHRDREVFLAGLWEITGFKQVAMPVNKLDKGTSTYDFKRKIAILINSITAFSSKPLVFIFYLGIIIMGVSGAAALYLVVKRLFFQQYLSGWPSLIVSVWLLGGITIFCIGIVGMYLSKIFTEVKDRPYTVIRKVYSRDGGE